jgi:hypothetical protein
MLSWAAAPAVSIRWLSDHPSDCLLSSSVVVVDLVVGNLRRAVGSKRGLRLIRALALLGDGVDSGLRLLAKSAPCCRLSHSAVVND